MGKKDYRFSSQYEAEEAFDELRKNLKEIYMEIESITEFDPEDFTRMVKESLAKSIIENKVLDISYALREVQTIDDLLTKTFMTIEEIL